MGSKAMLLLGFCLIIVLVIAPELAARQLAQTSTHKPKAGKTIGLNDPKYTRDLGPGGYGGPGGGGYQYPPPGAVGYGGPGGGGYQYPPPGAVGYGGPGGGGYQYPPPGAGGYQYGGPSGGGGRYPGHSR